MAVDGADDYETVPFRRESESATPAELAALDARPAPSPRPARPPAAPIRETLAERRPPQSVPRFVSHGPVPPLPYAGAGRGRPPAPNSQAMATRLAGRGPCELSRADGRPAKSLRRRR